jgi:DHA1 family bicyclomycin/chloramphenicol resistance-like MFS transporter
VVAAPNSIRFFLLLGCLSAAGPLAMDMYIPALPSVASDLDASTSATQLTIALYLVGVALGQVIFGQLSDVWGRRRPLLAGLLLFLLASGFCATTSSIVALSVGRFMQGVGGATGVVIGRTVVRDLYGVRASARYYSRLTLIYGVAPIVAPSIGAQILHLTSWHGIFLVIAGFGTMLFTGAVLWFPETLPSGQRRSGSLIATGRTFSVLLRNRRFLGCTLTLGFTTGALIAYVATATFVIQDGYGASPQLFGILFGVNAFAMVAGNQVNAHLLHRFSPSTLTATGLCMLVLGAVGLFTVAIGGLGLAALEGCLICVLGSWGFIQSNVLAVGLADQAEVAGAGSALLGLAQYATGALIAPLGGLGGSRSPIPFAVVTLTCGLVAAAAAYLLVLRVRPVRV